MAVMPTKAMRWFAGLAILVAAGCALDAGETAASEDADIAGLRREIEAPILDRAGIEAALKATRA